jgi:hypothetical protein
MAAKKWVGTTTPGDLSVGGNYSPAGVPITGDSLLIDGTADPTAITAGLATLIAVTLTSLTIKKSAPAVGTSAAKMQVGATLVNIGEPNIDGTTAQGAFVGLDLVAVATNVTVWDTASQGSGTMPPVQLAGSNAGNKLTVKAGRVGVAVGFGDTANFPELDVIGATAKVICGTGCSLTTLNPVKGELTVNSAWTTLNQTEGTFTHQGTGNAGTANVGGTAYFNSTGTIVAINVTGTADLSGNPAARTAPAAGVIPIKAFRGSTVNINNGVKLSISCNVQPQKCSAHEISLQTWPDTTMAFS